MSTIRIDRAIACVRAGLGLLLLTFYGGVSMASSEKGEPAALPRKIDGDYQVMPAQASDDLSLTQPLGSLLIDPAKISAIDGAKVRGKVEFIRLVGGANEIRVMMVDASGSTFFEEAVKVEVFDENDQTRYVLKKNWAFGSEWGNSRGTTIATFSKGKDGHLVVSLNMIGQGRTFVFPRGPTKAQAWLKYPPVSSPNTPVPPATPPKGGKK